MMINELTIGKFSFHPESEIPVIEILINGEVYGYLTPFRGYYFQVSKTYGGVHDLGSGINSCHLYNFLNENKEVETEMFDILASSTIYKCARIYQNIRKVKVDCKIDFRWMDPENTWEKFINESIAWVRKNNR